MKLDEGISQTAKKDLNKILNPNVLTSMCQRLTDQRSNGIKTKKYQDNQTISMKTPSTVDTNLKRRQNAISRSKRSSINKIKAVDSNQPSINNQISVTIPTSKNYQQKEQSIKNQFEGEGSVLHRKVLTDRAVYYGSVQLPYLHSSDAISSLYQRTKANQKENAQPLINPSTNINCSLLTNVKNLYLYYTSLDSLRQLGTGWSNLKSLTVMCSFLLRDLSGLSIFPSLQYLFVPYNNISQISDIMYHCTLRCVDLHDNKIDSIEQVQYLYTVTNLEWVDISQNPITQKKQKYRIICENLGNKIELQDSNKLVQFQQHQNQLDREFYSYQNIVASNCLIKQINQQILKQDLKIGDAWRSVQEKIYDPKSEYAALPDIQIITAFHESDDDQNIEQSNESAVNEGLKLRVTNLTQYVSPNINTAPLKKYFYNKVCPQSKPQKQKNTSNLLEKASQLSMTKTKRFALTQKLPQTTSQQKDKPRLTSVSLKKKIGRMSLSKNIGFSSTASSVLNSLKPKQQLINDINSITVNTGVRFMTKRKLLQKPSEQLPSKF